MHWLFKWNNCFVLREKKISSEYTFISHVKIPVTNQWKLQDFETYVCVNIIVIFLIVWFLINLL